MGGGGGIRLMRFRGVDVYLDFSVLIIMFIIVLPIVQNLPSSWSSFDVWTTAILIGVFYIGSILVHELGHATLGMWLGGSVSQIRLYVFGGATYFTAKPLSEGKNFWISIIGPLSNLALWGIFSFASHSASPFSVWGYVCDYIQLVNLILAIFNALPGYPMDGGQALRSAIIWLTKREIIAAWVVLVTGCLTGSAIGFIAIQALLNQNSVNALFAGYISAWIIIGSVTQFQQVVRPRFQPVKPTQQKPIKEAPVRGIIVGQVMSQPVRAFTTETKVADFLQQIEPLGLNDRSWLPILREGYLLGIVNRAIARKVPSMEQFNNTLDKIMVGRRELYAVNATEDIAQAQEKVRASENGLPVIVLGDAGMFVGFITRENIK